MSAVSALVSCVPLTGSVPDHAPEAVHAVALVDDQVIVVLPPLEMMLGLEVIVTVGAWAAVAGLDDETVWPDCDEVLDDAFVLIVFTSESHADNPRANANARGNSRQRIRNDNGECCRDSKYEISIG